MSDEVTIHIGVDTSKADRDLQALQQKVDAVQAHVNATRREAELTLSDGLRAVSLMGRAVRLAVRATGQAMDPIFDALLMSIQAAAGILLALAAAYTATGVLSEIGVILAGFSAGLTFGEAIALGQREVEVKRKLAEAEGRVFTLESRLLGFGIEGIGGYR